MTTEIDDDTAKEMLRRHLSLTDSKQPGTLRRIKLENGSTAFRAVIISLLLLLNHLFSGLPGATAVVLALTPVVPIAMLGLWLDRNEPEPCWLLVNGLVWGGGVATIYSLISSQFLNLFLLWNFFPSSLTDKITTVAGAPVIEEFFKGLGLWLLISKNRQQLDSRMDALIYTLFVGIGFAVVENVGYYHQATVSKEWKDVMFLLIARGVATPFLHPLFTLSTALGIYAAMRRTGYSRFFFVAAGYLGAVLLHATWNSGIGMMLYFPVGVPLFIWLCVRVFRAVRSENRYLNEKLEQAVLAKKLPPEVMRDQYFTKPIRFFEWIAASRNPEHPLHEVLKIRRLIWIFASPARASKLVREMDDGERVEERVPFVRRAACELIAEHFNWVPEGGSETLQPA